MKPVDFREVNLQVAEDLDVLLSLDDDPENFDVLLYKAKPSEMENAASDTEDVVGSLESGERAIGYDVPVPTVARFVQYDWPELTATLDGSYPNEGMIDETPVVLLLREQNISKQSIIEYDEYDADDQVRRVRLYVLDSKPYGRTPVICWHHFCVPMPM